MAEATSPSREIVDLLNQILKVEYSMIVNYPRLTSRLENEATREKALRLGQDSVRHADIVSNLITELGGEPDWGFDAIPEEIELVALFQKQLEMEKLAYTTYHKCAGLTPDTHLQKQLQSIAEQEKDHIQLVNEILTELGKS